MKGKEKIMSNALMAPRKNKQNEPSKAIAQVVIDQYQPETAEDMQDALRDFWVRCLKQCFKAK